jgi:antirestriction protein ArdC
VQAARHEQGISEEMTMTTQRNIYQEVTDSIIAAMETAGDRWEMPWHRAGGFTPTNASTKKPYRGLNTIILWSKRRPSNLWATYKQWQAMGAQVRKGEKGTALVKWKEVENKKAKEGDKRKTILIPLGFVIFNSAQVDGFVEPSLPVVDITTTINHADAAIARTRADIRHGVEASAYYQPELDYIHMPNRVLFKDTSTSDATSSYYSTLLHELTHWTGHKSREARDLSGRFGNAAYAAEELVAELGAAFACARLGITSEPRVDHAKYLNNWLAVLKSDNKAIFKAASLAQAACDRLIPVEEPAKDEEKIAA